MRIRYAPPYGVVGREVSTACGFALAVLRRTRVKRATLVTTAAGSSAPVRTEASMTVGLCLPLPARCNISRIAYVGQVHARSTKSHRDNLSVSTSKP
jgi:hypothetical protein